MKKPYHLSQNVRYKILPNKIKGIANEKAYWEIK